MTMTTVFTQKEILTMTRKFTLADVIQHSCIANAGKIYANSTNDFHCDMLDWQKQGLSQTASGYGAKLTTYYKINFEGKLYRLYNTCFSNAGSTWFKTKGKKIFVD